MHHMFQDHLFPAFFYLSRTRSFFSGLSGLTLEAALQKQIFVGWQGTRCFNLVAEPRWFLALATLLIAVVAGCWFGDVLQEATATFAKNTPLQYGVCFAI